MTDVEQKEVLIITGMSGAGRSTAADALEDLGWYVVDNLPPQMLRPLVELVERASSGLPKIAAVVDIRGRDFFDEISEMISVLRGGTELRVVFLDATDAALVRRFESVRRPHPLQADGTLLDGIGEERARLGAIREASDIVIDTSELNIHQLAMTVTDLFAEEGAAEVRVTIVSFGFKYGVPADADHVADARFLPNPFWVPELRAQTGLDAPVKEFVLGQPGAREFIQRYAAALEPVLAGYSRENKRHATIAIGCTGGKHRSVALARELAHELEQIPGIGVSVKNRDLGRE
ncbi:MULTISPECIES: RNase adapter RapZ [unclassified Leifsonia]|uniref:RNase adapter RapZ n=1 Tax=unclassified Leifsonia TaxID=2663824 RepID=UPI0006FB58F5|nr:MULTISPECIES: RNase adapter RapZ [unclassified Leifsonia]KQX06845.1 glmZ(sRNA)-inactivating NTPase [Leifsonia sp. Root1293]KRA11130.1 glmZ(sRNA)-inactivating NTPase [Leifsonia sp. Root60]